MRIAAICKSSLNNIQLPYMRATQRVEFFWLFLAVWMDILSLLAACGALARTLSTCMDAMSGGMARIYLLGRNSPDNEPWPDVLGVSIVFLLAVMFMLGLEVYTHYFERCQIANKAIKNIFLEYENIWLFNGERSNWNDCDFNSSDWTAWNERCLATRTNSAKRTVWGKLFRFIN